MKGIWSFNASMSSEEVERRLEKDFSRGRICESIKDSILKEFNNEKQNVFEGQNTITVILR